MIKNKLIKTRKDKKFSQQDLARHLNISQTQYLRKEKGDSKISDEEWDRIASLLNVEVDEIKENDQKTISQNFESVSNSYYVGSNNIYCSIPEHILDSQKEYIELLKKEIIQLKEKISKLQD